MEFIVWVAEEQETMHERIIADHNRCYAKSKRENEIE